MKSSSGVVIIDSGGANLASLGFAFERLGVNAIVSADASVIRAADRVVLPGVGNAAAVMRRLESNTLTEVIRALTCPVLGICLGMQLLFDASAEGDTQGLGLISGRIEAMTPEAGRPVPHMGWNTLQGRWDDPLLHGLGERDWFYFVHGFFAKADERYTLASTDYGISIAAVVRHGHFRGVQFHPERSGASGARLLKNFLSVRP